MKSLQVVLLLLGLFSGSMCAPSQQVEEAADMEPVEEEPVEENESPPLGDPLAQTASGSEYYLVPLGNQPQGLNYQQQDLSNHHQQPQMGYCYCPMASTQQQPAYNYPYMYMTYSTSPSRYMMSSPQHQTQAQQYAMYWASPKY